MQLHYPSLQVVRLSRLLTAVFLFCSYCYEAHARPAALPSMGEQIAFPGQFLPPFDYLNAAAANPLDVDGNGQADIIPACSCGNQPIIPNGSLASAGVFYDQVIIATGVSGQTWRLQASSGVLRRSSLAPYAAGTLIPEVGQSGVYVLPFAHRSEQGFIALVEAPFLYPGQVFGPLENTCYYPSPRIEGLVDFYCQGEADVQMTGSATTAFDDHLTELTPALGFFSIFRVENGQTINTSVFSPGALGPGTYKVRYLFDAGPDAYGAENKTGCIATAEQEVIVRGGGSLACQSSLNLSFPAACSISVTPQLVIAGTPSTFESFSVEVFTAGGLSLGNTIPASYTGQTLTAVLTDECSNSTCNTLLTVRDVTAPVLQKPADVTLPCDQSTAPSNTGFATATDCTQTTVTYTDQTTQSQCATNPIVIQRTWRAVDQAGNVSTGVQTIRTTRVTQSQLRFPEDVTVSCADYQANPDVIAPTAAGAGVPALVEVLPCGLAYTHSDDTLALCGGITPDFIIVRTWLLIDVCGSSLFTVDGLGNDNMQFIRVADTLGPVIQAANVTLGAALPPLTQGGLCRSQGFIPPAQVIDDCNNATVRIYTPVGEALYPNGQTDGSQGGELPFPGLTPGQYEIVYEATDDCGNATLTEVTLTIEDALPPIPLCDGQVTVSLPAVGLARLDPEDIDEGSRDDCCGDDVLLEIKLLEEPDSAFRAFIDLDCTNATVTAVLKVTDCNGLANFCQSVVTIEDRQPVLLQQAPPNATRNCDDDYANYLLADFQAPVFTDNCNFEVTFQTNVVLDDCGIGYIDRSWTARDNPGNFPASYTQRITFAPEHLYGIAIPADGSGDCAAQTFSEPALEEADGCNDFEWSVTEEWVRLSGGDYCYELRRTHLITNLCEYDGASPPLALPRFDGPDAGSETGDAFRLESDGASVYRVTGSGSALLGPATGRYQYVQLVRIVDTLPPVIEPAGELSFCVPDEGDCVAAVSVPLSAEDNCPDSLVFSYLFRLNQSGPPAPDAYGQLRYVNGKPRIEGSYPTGAHEWLVTVADACGNMGILAIPFTVRDCTPPQLGCIPAQEIVLDETGQLILTAPDLVAFVSDNCGDPLLSLDPNDPTADSLILSCDNVGQIPVIVYAIDDAGLRETCSVLLTLQALEAVCNNTHTLEGYVRKEDGAPVPGAAVLLEGPHPDTVLTDAEGYYRFEEVPADTNYILRPLRDDNHSLGLSTFDIILINRHILNIQPLGSPYKIIAADVNKTTTVSTADVIRMRRIILDIDSVFVGNTSWRFIDERYLFLDPQFPLAEPYPEVVRIDTLREDLSFNFIAIKVGDLNNSAEALQGPGVELRSPLGLRVEDRELAPGEVVDIRLRADHPGVLGGQLALQWPAEELAFEGHLPTPALPADDHLNDAKAAEGLLSLCWHPGRPEAAPELAFRFRALRPLRLAEVLRLAPERIAGELYTEAGVHKPVLVFSAPATAEARMQPPWPNPFRQELHFDFSLPAPAEVRLRLRDALGRVVYEQRQWTEAGAHRWTTALPLLQGQALFYEWQAGAAARSGKAVKSPTF